jgi:hypothetical protein
LWSLRNGRELTTCLCQHPHPTADEPDNGERKWFWRFDYANSRIGSTQSANVWMQILPWSDMLERQICRDLAVQDRQGVFAEDRFQSCDFARAYVAGAKEEPASVL